ncbi:hypothetical protein [Paracraurococcus lichenis]|uniref:DUF2946 domain-containing protein n=1 Tax=Paracraurococcus lichenis TaxID=3064888 RepID=A0ABT9ECA0_9PROT|nr:hypothetical protein [Paracraurococcus sp. LOR1-02]MDO9713809.1 hypothetical protein [Paracraurococcus sp. LOR1-02]
MPRGTGRFRRAIAALLALALLVLPGAPMRHASAAQLHAQPAGHAHVHDCLGHGEEATLDHALAGHDDDGQADRHPGDQQMPGCCTSAQCPANVAVPPMPPALRLALPLARVTGPAPPPAPDGIGVDPPMHPPRALA